MLSEVPHCCIFWIFCPNMAWLLLSGKPLATNSMQAGFNLRGGGRMNIGKGLLLCCPSAQTIWQVTGTLGTHAYLQDYLSVTCISKRSLFSINSKLCFLSWEPAGAVHSLWLVAFIQFNHTSQFVSANPPGTDPLKDLTLTKHLKSLCAHGPVPQLLILHFSAPTLASPMHSCRMSL